jgi:uncharacterized protein YdgA (DUF945 family)
MESHSGRECVKKPLIAAAAAAALLVAYPLLSWLTGYAVERRIQEPVEQMRNVSPYAKVVESTFRRGWFTSEHDLTIEFFGDSPEAAAGAGALLPRMFAPFQLKIRSVIRHGPLCGWACIGVAHAETHTVFSGPIQAFLTDAFGAAEPLHIESRMGFGGGGSATISSPPIKDAVLKDGGHVSWGGFLVHSESEAQFTAYRLRGSFPRMVYAGADGKGFELGEVEVEINSHRALRTLNEGSSSVSIGHLGYRGPASVGLSIKDIHAISQSDSSGGLMAVVSKTSTGAITAGPLAFTGMHIDFTLRHLDMESLETLNVALRDVNRGPPLPSSERSQKMLAALKEPGIAFLSHQPEIVIDRISVAAAQGETQLSGAITVHDVAPADFDDPAQQKNILQKLDVDLDLTVDQAFLKALPGGGGQFAPQLQSLVQQGSLTYENGKYHTKILFHQGMATFNGRPMPQASQPPAVVRPMPRR